MDERLSQAMSDILLHVEETRQLSRQGKGQQQRVDDILPLLLQGVEDCLPRLDEVRRLSLDSQSPEAKDIYDHCHGKVRGLLEHFLTWIIGLPENLDEEREDARQERQQIVARLVDLALWLEATSNTANNESTTIPMYVTYQTTCLRLRVKPHVATLVVQRQQHGDAMEVWDDYHHTHVMGVILGQAAALSHPLILWETSLSPGAPPPHVESLRQLCHEATRALHQQTVTLTAKISEWFWKDVQLWLKRATEDVNLSNGQLTPLHSLVDDVAHVCQLLARYQGLVDSAAHYLTEENANAIRDIHLPEWTWKYASLERYLALQQWESALQVASPLKIVVDTHVLVPSLVEDATYLSTMALARAADTAGVGTVAHALSHDVWSPEAPHGIYRALLDKTGCYGVVNDIKKDNESDQVPKSGDFASALVDALDEDLTSAASPPGAPASDGFLSSMTSSVGTDDKWQQVLLETQFCALNGMQAAAGACRSLVHHLNAVLHEIGEDQTRVDRSLSMAQLAMEELSRYAEAYTALQETEIAESIKVHCGPSNNVDASRSTLCFDRLRAFLQNENYELDATTIFAAEADERLDHEFLGPLSENSFLTQLTDRCEAKVLTAIGSKLIEIIVSVVRETLWFYHGSSMTDWGSMLLSKEIRCLQNFFADLLTPPGDHDSGASLNLLQAWERLSQVSTIVQLERPADWLGYHASESTLTPEELRKTLSLRSDFSPDAIASVVAGVTPSTDDARS